MSQTPESEPERQPLLERLHLQFRRADQPALALVLVACLAVLGFRVYQIWRVSHRIIRLDDAPIQKAQLEVDVNAADWSELSALPGIGEVLARSIVEYRDQHGPFSAVEDLTAVQGIGEGRLNEIKPYVVIRRP